MLEEIKKRVFKANMQLVEYGLMIFDWGSISEIDKKTNLVVVIPNGIDYKSITCDDMVVVDLDGNIIEGYNKPSTDLSSHLEIYKAFNDISSVVHTHSTYATIWAQAGRDIPFYGTTHAEYFYGNVPCTRELTKNEVESEYERNTGLVIIEKFLLENINSKVMPGAIVHSHGPFNWGKDAYDAVNNAIVLENIAKMALYTENINHNIKLASRHLLDKHYFKKGKIFSIER
jgi:L-ribulose-5-phosphate 4-epimerase